LGANQNFRVGEKPIRSTRLWMGIRVDIADKERKPQEGECASNKKGGGGDRSLSLKKEEVNNAGGRKNLSSGSDGNKDSCCGEKGLTRGKTVLRRNWSIKQSETVPRMREKEETV